MRLLILFFAIFIASLSFAKSSHDMGSLDMSELRDLSSLRPTVKQSDKDQELNKFLEGGNRSLEYEITVPADMSDGITGEKKEEKQRCQGTPIGCNKLLTAAHCAEQFHKGESFAIKTADLETTANIKVHPEYAKAYEENKGKEKVTRKPDGSINVQLAGDRPYDVGVISLEKSLCAANPKIKPQTLCKKDDLKEGGTVWGASKHLKKMLVGTMEALNSIGSKREGSEIAFQDPEGIKQGDSGGGLFLKTRKGSDSGMCVAGVLSGGRHSQTAKNTGDQDALVSTDPSHAGFLLDSLSQGAPNRGPSSIPSQGQGDGTQPKKKFFDRATYVTSKGLDWVNETLERP